MGFKQQLLAEETSPRPGTTSAEKGKIRVIIQHLLDGDTEWFRKKDTNINIGNKSGYWVLNYGLGERTQWNYLCRGLIIKQPPADWSGDNLSLCVSIPMFRFYNQGEENAAKINFADADMLEKLDGTMVGATRLDDKVMFHTRKMHSEHPKDMNTQIKSLQDPSKTMVLMREIKAYVDKLPLDRLDQNTTFVFEFIHESSFVWTKYTPEQYGLYLIAARDVRTHEEFSEGELDGKAQELGVRRPRRWNAVHDAEQIAAMMKQAAETTPDFEGFVFRDRKTGARLKIKDPKYVEMHHNLDQLRFKNLIVALLNDEGDEISSYFPSAREMFRTLRRQWDRYIDKVYLKVKEWQRTGLRTGELTNALFGHNPLPKWQIRLMKIRGEEVPKPKKAEQDSFVVDHILRCIDMNDEQIRRTIVSDLREKVLGQGKNAGNPKEVLEMIGVKDDNEADTQYDDG